MNTRNILSLVLALSLSFAATACGGSDDSSSGGDSNGATSNSTSSSNGTTGMTSNGTTGDTSNGTSSTSNGTTGNTSNGTTGNTSNGTTGTSNGTTTTFEGVGLTVGDDARACELVLLDPQNAVQNVTFDDTVDGRFMRRGERLAIAFHATEDASIAPGAVAFEVAEGQAGMLQVSVPRCFDDAGKVLDNALLDLNR